MAVITPGAENSSAAARTSSSAAAGTSSSAAAGTSSHDGQIIEAPVEEPAAEPFSEPTSPSMIVVTKTQGTSTEVLGSMQLPPSLPIWNFLQIVSAMGAGDINELRLQEADNPLTCLQDVGSLPSGGSDHMLTLLIKNVKPEHCYVVWQNPSSPKACGIWCGGSRAWSQLLLYFPASQYAGSGARLRRSPSLVEAHELYMSEAKKHASPLPPPIHWA